MRLLSFLLFLVFIAFALFARWYYVCEIKQLCKEEPLDVRIKTLRLVEGDSVILRGYDQFAFDYEVISPRLNDNNIAFLDTVSTILDIDSTKNLTITAFYRNSEEGFSFGFFENIGDARADKVRSQLVRRGISENRITLDHGISEDSLLREPLLFEIYQEVEEFEKIVNTFVNMTFSDANFAFDSDEFNPGTPFISYADSVKTFLELNPEMSVTIIGHTDFKGTEKYNMDLGMRRANSAREYLKDIGVEANIEIQSMGKKKPVATNETEQGRQKNRRVNFQLK